MKKYVVGSYSEVYDDTDNLEGAKNIFNETVEEEGEFEDIFLYEVLTEHKAPSEKEYNPHPHFNIMPLTEEQQLNAVKRLEEITDTNAVKRLEEITDTNASGWFKGERYL